MLSGEKTATSSLRLEYDEPGEVLPEVGVRSVVVDSGERRVCVIETTEVRLLRLDEVDEQFARDEGEGFETVDDWREAHEQFFGRPLEPETEIVAVRFRVVKRL